jgi:hypothetical protein
MAQGYIVVDGLAEFRRALRSAIGKAPLQLTVALKKGAEPILMEARGRSPRLTGALASSLRASVRGATGEIVSSVPYAGGAEWGRYRRWSGFSGAPPRFVWPAVETKAEEAMDLIAEGLRDVLTVEGWFSGF